MKLTTMIKTAVAISALATTATVTAPVAFAASLPPGEAALPGRHP